MTKIYIITWQYYDKSAFGLVRGFAKADDANETIDFLGRHGDSAKEFKVIEIDLKEEE